MLTNAELGLLKKELLKLGVAHTLCINCIFIGVHESCYNAEVPEDSTQLSRRLRLKQIHKQRGHVLVVSVPHPLVELLPVISGGNRFTELFCQDLELQSIFHAQ